MSYHDSVSVFTLFKLWFHRTLDPVINKSYATPINVMIKGLNVFFLVTLGYIEFYDSFKIRVYRN